MRSSSLDDESKTTCLASLPATLSNLLYSVIRDSISRSFDRVLRFPRRDLLLFCYCFLFCFVGRSRAPMKARLSRGLRYDALSSRRGVNARLADDPPSASLATSSRLSYHRLKPPPSLRHGLPRLRRTTAAAPTAASPPNERQPASHIRCAAAYTQRLPILGRTITTTNVERFVSRLWQWFSEAAI